ncbi:hypothetical protein PVMG_02389 [Plasmodium vivax Mauritania I]|uniref:Uncharacterized protein n=1 Tax=Plasmodium vivax Mauritania I TaxID=1035515 RepID=A0A0J9W1Z2_PLAVI|nr:hypothetical protein PVMG_02389 [Plasmodium vivax Mauritania I]
MALRNRGEDCDPRKRKAQGGAVRRELAAPPCQNDCAEDNSGEGHCGKDAHKKDNYAKDAHTKDAHKKDNYAKDNCMKDDCMKDDCMKDVTGEERARAGAAAVCASPRLCRGEGPLEEGPPGSHPTRHPSPQPHAEYEVKELAKLMEKYDVRKNFACFGGAFARFANETYTFSHRHFRPHLGIHMNTYLLNDYIFMKNFIKIIKFSRWHILVYLSDNKLYVYKHSRYLWHLDHFNEWKHLPLPTTNEIKDIQIVSCNYKGDLYFDHPKGPNYEAKDDYPFSDSTHQHETIDPIHFFGLSLIDSKDNLYLGMNINVNSSRINIKQMKMVVPQSFEKRKLRMRTILVSLPELTESDLRSCAVYLRYASIFEISYTRAGSDTGEGRASCAAQGEASKREAPTPHVEKAQQQMDPNQPSKVDYRKGSKKKGRTTSQRGRISQRDRASQRGRASPKGKNKSRGSVSKPLPRGTNLSGSVHGTEEKYAANSLHFPMGEVQRGEDHHGNLTRESAKKKRRISRNEVGGPPGQVPQNRSSSNGGGAPKGGPANGGAANGAPANGAAYNGGMTNPSSRDNPPSRDDPPSAAPPERATLKKDRFIFIKTSNHLKFKKRLIHSKPKVLLSGTSCAHGCVLFENKEIYFWMFRHGGSPVAGKVVTGEVAAEEVAAKEVNAGVVAASKGRPSERFTFKKLEYPKLNIVDVVYCNNTYIMLSEDNNLFILKAPYLHTLRAVNFLFYLSSYLPKGLNPQRRSGGLTLEKIRDSSLVKMYLTDYILVTVHSSKDICFTPVLFHRIYSYMDSQYIDVLSTKYERQVTKLIKDLGKFCTRGLENQFSHEEKSRYPNLIKYKMIRTCAQNKNCFTIYVTPNSLVVCIYNLFEYYEVLDTSISNFLSKYYIV